MSSHYEPQIITETPQEVNRQILEQTKRWGKNFKLALAFMGVLFLLGIIGFIIRLTDGLDDFTPWGYFMATYAFLLTTASSAPIVSITQRMVRSHWRRPMARASETFAVVGVLSTLMFIPLILLLPSADGRRSIWFEWPGTPLFTDLLAVVFLAVLGLMLLWVASIPDLAARRDHDSTTPRWVSRLAMEWRGTTRQWNVLRGALMIMGAMYFLFLVYVHTIIAADFAEALVPGWKDAILPTYHALSGLQSAFASTILATFLLYKFGGFKDFISKDQFWAAGKIMFALSLLWAYFWMSGFIVYWYGRQPAEQTILRYLMFDAYIVPFIITVFLNFLVPFLVLLWNFARKSILGPTIVAVSILIGTLFDRIRLYVASFSAADKTDSLDTLHPEPLSEVLPAVMPGGPDVLIVIGGIAGAIFLYMLATKIIPPVSIWEITEGMLYRKKKTFLKRTIMVMGKPE